LLAGLAPVVLLIHISIAVLSTKIPILLGHGSMWLGSLFLLIVGAGKTSSFEAVLMPGHSA
jgi:hypothetical protein